MRIPKLFDSNKFISESENKSCFGAALYTASKVLIYWQLIRVLKIIKLNFQMVKKPLLIIDKTLKF